MNYDVAVGHLIKKESDWNMDRRSAIRLRQVEAKEVKFRSKTAAEDEGSSKSKKHRKELLSLVSSFSTAYAKISWKFSVSLTFGILLSMPSVGVESKLISLPVDTLVIVGKTARINCSTDLHWPVYWARTLAGDDAQLWLYYGKNGFNSNNADSRFSVDKDEATGRYDLIIADVQMKDAGQYVCVDESGLGVKASAELVVSDPIDCNSRIPSDGVMGNNVFGLKQDFIQVSCSITYTGNLPLTLKWSWPGSEVEGEKRAVSAATSSVTSTLKLSPTKEHNNVTFQCKANIESATQDAVDNGLLWESKTVNVRYAEFASVKVELCPGVDWNLICNPQCSYSFERKADDCQCLYKYYVERTQLQHQVTSDAVKCDNDGKMYLLSPLIAVSFVPVLLVAIIVTVFCLKRRNRRNVFL